MGNDKRGLDASLVLLCMAGASLGCDRLEGRDLTRVVPTEVEALRRDPGMPIEPPETAMPSSGPSLAPSSTRDVVETSQSIEVKTPAEDAVLPGPAAMADAGVSAEPADSIDTESSSALLSREFPIVFRSDRASPGVSDLYVMTADGTETRRVTRDGEFRLPKWSPDGQSIAFRQLVAGGQAAEVGVVAPDGTQRTLLTRGQAAELNSFSPHWSPDGERISFASNAGPDGVWVWTTSRSGGQQQPLFPELEGTQREASWSWSDPDEIAYAPTSGIAVSTDVWVTTPSKPLPGVNLTRGRVFSPRDLRWSPDGTRIAFHAFAVRADGSIEGLGNHLDAGPSFPDYEIFMIDVGSGVLTRLTDNVGDDWAASWSPDGRSLIFSSDRDGDVDIWTLPLHDPSQTRNLIDDDDAPHWDSAPDWYWAPRGG